jgi:hypothetical protein
MKGISDKLNIKTKMGPRLMFKVPACVFAAGCIGSSLYCFFVRNMKNSKTKHLESLLDDTQIEKYYAIMKERRNIFIFGKIVGLLLGFLYITYNKLDGWCKYCVFVVIVKIVACIVYMMYPKSDYFLRHVTTKEQSSAWVDVYVEMKYNMFFGFILGMLGYLILMRLIA